MNLTLLSLARHSVSCDPSSVRVSEDVEGKHHVEILLPVTDMDELREGARLATGVFKDLAFMQHPIAVRVSFLG